MRQLKTTNGAGNPAPSDRWFGRAPFRTSRAALGSLSFPFDASGVTDETMQAIVDEAKTEAEAACDPDGFTFQAGVIDAAKRHGVPFKKEISDWTVTDASCNQRCRIHVVDNGHALAYEYEQDTDVGKAEALITVGDYDYQGEKFAADYLLPFGYENIAAVRSIYGVGWEQIVAECIFETDLYEFI
jgi:hypothetical protein